jgi:hypothetical protein
LRIAVKGENRLRKACDFASGHAARSMPPLR